MSLITEVCTDVFLAQSTGGRLWRLPVPAQCALVRLPDGGLWISAPVTFGPALSAAISGLGSPQYLMVPNERFVAALPDWMAAWPALRLYAPPHLGARIRQDLGYDCTDLDGAGPWENIISYQLVENAWGGPDAVFFHHGSRALIVADLIVNLDTAKMPPWTRPLVWCAGIDTSDGKMPPTLRRYDREKLGDEIEQILQWDVWRILLVHGECFPTQGREEIKRAFRRVLRDREWDRLLSAAKEGKPPERR